MVTKAASAAQSLTPLEPCGDAKALLARAGPPVDAATAQKIETLRGEFARVGALREVGKYREALAKLTLKTPTGDVKLDANRQAIGTTFITEVVKDDKGNLFNKVVSKIDNVEQTLGIKPADFKIGSRDEPNCP